MRNFSSFPIRAALMLGMLHLAIMPAMAEDKSMAPGHAAGHSAAALAPLSPGKAAGKDKAQSVSQGGGLLIIGLGGLVIAGAVLVVSGGGGGKGEGAAPQNFSMSASNTAP
jgi:hypothetical protein